MESVKTSVAVLTLMEDSIILFKVNPHSDLGVKELIEVREANYKLNNERPYCVLMKPGEFSESSKEAREVSASKEHAENRIALAVIQDSIVTKFAMRFYLKFNKPVSPTKAFGNKEEAIVWLREMRDAYYSK